MGAMVSQITSFIIAYSTVYSGTNQRKHQSSASLALVRGIHRWPVNSPHKGPVTRKMFTFDDVIMSSVITGFHPHKKDRLGVNKLLKKEKAVDLRPHNDHVTVTRATKIAFLISSHDCLHLNPTLSSFQRHPMVCWWSNSEFNTYGWQGVRESVASSIYQQIRIDFRIISPHFRFDGGNGNFFCNNRDTFR